MIQIISFIFLVGFVVLLLSVGAIAAYVTKLLTSHKRRHHKGIGKYLR